MAARHRRQRLRTPRDARKLGSVLSVEAVDLVDSAARRIAQKLADLAALHAALGEADPSLLPFDRLDDSALRALESRLGVTLPAAYRAFARHVGTTGAGPDLGLAGPGILPAAEEREGAVAPDPRRPFPLDAAWHPLDDDGAPRPFAAAAEAAAAGHALDGTLRLTELGDGCFTFLVLAGPRAGEVWEDLSAEGGPIQPVAPLLPWYEAWVDELLVDGLVEAMRRAMPPGQTSPADETLQRWGALLEQRARPAAPDEAAAQRGDDAGAGSASASDEPPRDARALAAQALWKLYQGRLDEARALIAELDELPPDEAEQLPEGMCEALTLWSHAAAAADALDPTPAAAERLMTHPSWRVRRLLAQSPATPALALGWLAADARLEVRCAVAANPAATPEVLREVRAAATALWRTRADHPEALFALDLLARHPNLPAEELSQLAGWVEAWPAHRTAAWVVRAVAYNPSTPPSLLARLARHPHPCVREAVAQRRDATEPTLNALAGDPDPTVREAVAANPFTSLAELPALAADPAERVRYRVAGRRDLPAALQRQLAGDFATSVLLALGEREHLDPEAAELLALRPPIILPGEEDDILHDGPYQAVAPAEPPSPEELFDSASDPHPTADGSLNELAAHRARRSRRDSGERSAVNPAAPRLDLEILPPTESRLPAEETAFDRRRGAALVTLVTARAVTHPGYPAPLLAPLLAPLRAWLASADASAALPAPAHAAGNLDDLIGYAGAAHPWLEKDAMRILVHSTYAPARARLASHPLLPAPIVALLLEDPSPLVQKKLALRGDAALPITLLEAWAVSDEVESRIAAACSPHASASVLAALARDPQAFVRRAVAANPAASDELVAALARDPDADVRRALTWRPTLAPELVAQLADDASEDVRAWAAWRAARDRRGGV
jgi:hypothetical protein